MQDFPSISGKSGDNFECEECHKSFKYDSHYQRHVLTHSDYRPFGCNCCEKKFKRQDALKTHERTHYDDLPYGCSQIDCHEKFASKAALRYHELRHINLSEFFCHLDGCSKKFLTLGQLKQHQKTKLHARITSSSQSLRISSKNNKQTIKQDNHDRRDRVFQDKPDSPIIKIDSLNCEFIDKFTNEERSFINQIWNSSLVIQSKDKEQQNDYPLQKRRKLFSSDKGGVSSSSAAHSNLLLEFSRISSGNSSQFGLLKQELRIVVGLINKIKMEDEDYEIQIDSNDQEKPNQIVNQFESENQSFYQKDQKAFHSYECKHFSQMVSFKLDKEFNFKGKAAQKIKSAIYLLQQSQDIFIEERKEIKTQGYISLPAQKQGISSIEIKNNQSQDNANFQIHERIPSQNDYNPDKYHTQFYSYHQSSILRESEVIVKNSNPYCQQQTYIPNQKCNYKPITQIHNTVPYQGIPPGQVLFGQYCSIYNQNMISSNYIFPHQSYIIPRDYQFNLKAPFSQGSQPIVDYSQLHQMRNQSNFHENYSEQGYSQEEISNNCSNFNIFDAADQNEASKSTLYYEEFVNCMPEMKYEYGLIDYQR